VYTATIDARNTDVDDKKSSGIFSFGIKISKTKSSFWFENILSST
jgi:hypothetical protein